MIPTPAHHPSRSPAPSSPRRSRRRAPLLEPLEPRTLFSLAPSPAPSPAVLVAQANNAFAFDLFNELRTNNPGNLFFSPYSIATALEMTLQGAQGATAAEIIQALHLPPADLANAGFQALYQLFQADPATAGYTLSTANRLWIKDNYPLLQSFLDSTQNLFGAGAQSVDFSNPAAAADLINGWVSDQTHGKIQNLIPASAINCLTRLILTNAIYFKGDWASAFNAYGTHDASFQVSADQVMTVNMMQQENYFGYYAQSGPNGFQAVDLPYQGNDVDMLVILPTSSSIDGLESSFTPDLFSQITSNLHSAEVNLLLPKFTLNETYDLVTPLEDLGIKGLFADQEPSGLTAIAPPNPNESVPYVTDVIHKSYIQVDETGTEAAAATAVIIGVQTGVVVGPPPMPILFNADHPFLVAIRERSTNTILFLGTVTDPGYDPNGNAPPPTANPPTANPPGFNPIIIQNPIWQVLPPTPLFPITPLPPITHLPAFLAPASLFHTPPESAPIIAGTSGPAPSTAASAPSTPTILFAPPIQLARYGSPAPIPLPITRPTPILQPITVGTLPTSILTTSNSFALASPFDITNPDDPLSIIN